MEGWVKLHRKFVQWQWYDKSEMVHLFIHLLLNANREPGEWRGIKIGRGQLLTGLNSLHVATKISIRTLRTCLTRLQKTSEIDTQTTNKYTIITIINYESYQGWRQATDSENDKQPTSNRQATDNKQEVEEEKEYKEEQEKKVLIDYDFILNNYHELCKNMPRVIKLAGERKGYVNARFGEFGMEKIIEVLRLAGESDFLNGENDKRWKADFEWIMRPNNFIKILEGKYNNKPKKLILAR